MNDDQRNPDPDDPQRGPTEPPDASDAADGPTDPTDGEDDATPADPPDDAAGDTDDDRPSDEAFGDAGFDDAGFDDAPDEAFGEAGFDDDEAGLDGLLLDDHELAHIQRDLDDLSDFEAAFRPEGYRGVAVWCHDCAEEHFYPWDMLRENLQVLIETGETPVHEPAFAPEPDRYIPWDYARGYVDALRDTGVDQRLDAETCPRCQLALSGDAAQANYCPRCAAPLLVARLLAALTAHGVDPSRIDAILRETGLPG